MSHTMLRVVKHFEHNIMSICENPESEQPSTTDEDPVDRFRAGICRYHRLNVQEVTNKMGIINVCLAMC